MSLPNLQVPFDQVERTSLLVPTLRSNAFPRWDRFVRSHPGGTPFHLTAWMHALEDTFGYRPKYVYTEQGNQITGVLPLFKISNWIMGSCFLSTPFAVYGGICAEDGPSTETLRERAAELARSEGVDFLELRSRHAIDGKDLHSKDLYFSFTLDLARDVEENLKRLPKDTRYMIRKGEKAGLKTRSGLDQLSAFYQLFATSMRRLGTPVLPYRWLLNLAEQFPGQADLTLVYSGSRAVAGAFSFIFRDTLLPYYTGAVPEATKLAANNFLYWELIKKAAGLGLRRFDFGRSKKGTGAFHFKSSWNLKPEPLEYQVLLVKRRDVPNFSPMNPKFDLAIRLWRHLPFGITKWLGPLIVRCFP